MSYVISDKIIKDTTLNTNEILVLGFLTTQQTYNNTLKEMCSEIGVRSVSTLRNTLRSLVNKGYVFISEQGVNSPTTYSVIKDYGEETPREEVFEEKINPRKILLGRRNILD